MDLKNVNSDSQSSFDEHVQEAFRLPVFRLGNKAGSERPVKRDARECATSRDALGGTRDLGVRTKRKGLDLGPTK